ncbi:MAG TPA: hypothetical protein DEA47_05625 [Peptococcaceae bacterium]|nr:MAG: hypothetical protein XD50_0754 [Clostridia bacterium 41_269]HBT20821.1 hypothetical protein [Peptococcaceae bacterium]
MRKGWLWFGVLLAAFLFAACPVVEVQAEDLKADTELTRGEFAGMLAEKAGIKAEKILPAELLKQKGIVKGYPGGELFLDRSITRAEAAAMVVRTLGLEDEVLFSLTSKEQREWAYAFCSWLERYGLIEGDPFGVMTREEGSAFLDRIFTSDPEALSIMEKAKEKLKEINDMSSTINAKIKIVPQTEAEETGILYDIEVNMEINQEIVMPDKVHQKITVEADVPGADKAKFISEMYYIGDKVYAKIPNEESGEMQWYRYPEGIYPDLNKVISDNSYSVPPELEKYIRYRMMGKTTINGEEVYQLACYGSIKDFNEFIETVYPQLGMDQQLMKLWEDSVGLMENISLWGFQNIGAVDFSDKGGELLFVITFTPEFKGEAVPIKRIQMNIKVEDLKYNQNLTIELPEEAVNAQVLSIERE